jgi:hypothetical protein
VLDGDVVGNFEFELIVFELFVEGDFGDGEGKAVLVERSRDDDEGREVDVAVFLVIGIGCAGDDTASGVVDVLLVGQQVGSADVDDALGVDGLALGLGEDFEIVVGLFEEIFLFVSGLDHTNVLGEGDDLAGSELLDEKGVEEDEGPEVFEAVLRGFSDLVGSDDGAASGGDEEFEGFAVADHIERLAADQGKLEEDPQLLGFAKEDVAAEGGVLFDRAGVGATGAGGDLDCGIHGLDGVIRGGDAAYELIEGCVLHHVDRAGLANHVRACDATGENRGQQKQQTVQRFPHQHE